MSVSAACLQSGAAHRSAGLMIAPQCFIPARKQHQTLPSDTNDVDDTNDAADLEIIHWSEVRRAGRESAAARLASPASLVLFVNRKHLRPIICSGLANFTPVTNDLTPLTGSAAPE